MAWQAVAHAPMKWAIGNGVARSMARRNTRTSLALTERPFRFTRK